MNETLLGSSLSDRITDVMVDHASQIATDVVVPAAKYAVFGIFSRHKRTASIAVVVLAGLFAAVKYWQRSKGEGEGGPDAQTREDSVTDEEIEVTSDIPTISDRSPIT